jgi:hypothetical protein
MLEKILPVIAMLVALQLLLRFMQRRRKARERGAPSRYSEYRDRIDRLIKVSNYDDGTDYEKKFSDEIRSGIANPELMMEIPENMRDVRRGLNLIIEGVNCAVKAKIGLRHADETKYRDPSVMFDELVNVVNKYRIK